MVHRDPTQRSKVLAAPAPTARPAVPGGWRRLNCYRMRSDLPNVRWLALWAWAGGAALASHRHDHARPGAGCSARLPSLWRCRASVPAPSRPRRLALAEARLDGTQIHTAIFTNFTQDHLDYHGSMADYWLAKARCSTGPACRRHRQWDDPQAPNCMAS